MDWMGRSSNPGGGKNLSRFHILPGSVASSTIGTEAPFQRLGQGVEHSLTYKAATKND